MDFTIDYGAFFAFLGALIFGAQHGFASAFGAAAIDLKDRGRQLIEYLEFYWNVFFARKSFRMLVISTGFSAVLLTFALITRSSLHGTHELPPWLLASSVMLLIGKIIYAAWMHSSIPEFLMNGASPRRHPEYRQDAQNRFLARNGRFLTYEEDFHGMTLRPGSIGSPIQVDDNGRLRRFFERNGVMVDGLTMRELRHPQYGMAIRYNAAGLVLAAYQDANGDWFDGVTGLAILTPTDPMAVLPGNNIDRNAVLDPDRDFRVRHPLANLPMLDMSRPNRLGRHSLVIAGLLTVADLFLVGITIIWIGLMNGPADHEMVAGESFNYVFGSRLLVGIGGLYVLSGLLFITGVAWLLMAAWTKSVQTMEFIAGIAIQEGLIVLPGITSENVATKFASAKNFINEMLHQRFVMGVLKGARDLFLLWFLLVLILPVSQFAELLFLILLVAGLLRHAGLPRALGFLALTLVVFAFPGIRHGLFGQTSNLVVGTEHTLDGSLGMTVWNPWVSLLAIAAGVGALILFSWTREQLQSDKAGKATKLVAGIHGAACLVFSLLSVLGAVHFVAWMADKPAIALSRTTPHDPPTAPIISAAELGIGPQGPSVRVTWTQVTGDATGFQVERGQDCQQTDKGPICRWYTVSTGKLAANVRSFKDTRLDPGEYYTYRVVAVNEAGKTPSEPSELVHLPATPSPSKDKAASKADPTPGPARDKQADAKKAPAEKEPVVRVASNTTNLKKGYVPGFLESLEELRQADR